jgi:hypothetical protein
VITQIKQYARALAANARWSNTKTAWTFTAVTYELDSDGVAETNQRDRPRNMIHIGENYTIWLRTWGAA